MRRAPLSDVGYDPLDLEADPYPAYRRLRDAAPVYAGVSHGGEFWAISRFEDVQAVARDWDTFSSGEGNDLDDTGLLFGAEGELTSADPPLHTRLRAAVKKEFGTGAVRIRLEAIVREKTRELISGLRERDVVDVAGDLAHPLPAAVMCEWLGFPARDHAQISAWHAAMLGRIDLGEAGVVVDGDVGVLPAGVAAALDTVVEDAFSDLPEAAQFLDVQVHQLARGRRTHTDSPVVWASVPGVSSRVVPAPARSSTAAGPTPPTTTAAPTRSVGVGARSAPLPQAKADADSAWRSADDPATRPTPPPGSGQAADTPSPDSHRTPPPQPAAASPKASTQRADTAPPTNDAVCLAAYPSPSRASFELWSSTTTRLAGGPDSVSRLAGS